MHEDLGVLQIAGQIFPLPELPPKIQEAMANKRLIVFVGAGVSSIIGCLRWHQLAECLIELSYKKGKINYWEKEKLKSNDARKIISILKNELRPEDYEKALEESLRTKPNLLKKYPIYEHLIKLRSIYITTNIDTCFDPHFEESRIFTKPDQFKKENVRENTLFKLHGTIKNNETVIFTTQDYIRHYNSSEVKDFLKHVFNSDFSVLFVGYSLEEIEILDYVLLKGGYNNGKNEYLAEEKHFLLLPFYKSEEGLLKFEQSYFKSLGVVTVPYAIDEKGYEQLYFVIERWEKEINVSTNYLYKSYEFIENNVDDYIDSNSSEIFQLIRNDDHFRNHFFQKVNTVRWFKPLKDKGFFQAQNAPGPQAADKEGSFSIPQWNVLPYLEKVSLQTNAPGNEEYIDELLAIIKDISLYRDTNGHHVDNYRTWWFFVKILINIPTNRISSDIIDLIPIWLSSIFDTSLPGADILNRLLPKFLENVPKEEDIEKAEKIIEYVTALKLSARPKQERIFSDDEKYELAIDSYWLENAFKKYSWLIGERCSGNVIRDLSNKIKTLFKKENYLFINNGSYSLKLIEQKERYLLQVYKREEDGNIKTFKEAFEDAASGRKRDEILSKEYEVQAESLIEFVEHAYDQLKENPIFQSNDSAELKGKLYNLYCGLYTEGTYRSFYEESKYGNDKAFDLLTFILKEILLAKAKKDTNVTRNILQNFFSEKHFYFSKMALFIIGNTKALYIDVFWEVLNAGRQKKYILLGSLFYGEELKYVLKNLSQWFPSDKEKVKLEQIIEENPQYVSGDDGEHQSNIWKQEIYGALISDPYFEKRYKALKEKTGRDAGLHAAIGPVKVFHGPGPSALQQEDFLQKTNTELAQFLVTFEEKDSWRGPTVRGLAEVLKQTVRDKPEKFVEDLRPFSNMPYLYMYYMFWGLKDACANKKDFDWQKLLNFIEEYIRQDEFWLGQLLSVDKEGWNPDQETVVGEISQLIQEGSKDDDRMFPDTLFEDAKRILWSIMDKLARSSGPEERASDYVTYSLNSTWGKAISAFIYLTLRIVRANDKKGETKAVKWDEDCRQRYSILLDDGIIEAYTWLGHYLPQLYYIDKKWVKERVTNLDPRTGTGFWEAFMNGYLYGGIVYNDVYKLMQQHYEYAINYDFKESRDIERLIQHISIGYLRGKETLETSKSLFRKILDQWNHQQIREIISYFWMQRDYGATKTKDAKKSREKILEFWRWVFEHFRNTTENQLDKNDRLLLSDLSKLTVFLPEINNENFQWLSYVTPYVKEDFNAHYFIECLDRLKDKSRDKVKTGECIGEIFLEMLEHFTPDYDQVHIRAIVDFLYDVGEKEKADRICNIYGSRGYEFLRDIYDKNNKPSQAMEMV